MAVFYPEDDRFLTARDLVAHHYEVASPAHGPLKTTGSDPENEEVLGSDPENVSRDGTTRELARLVTEMRAACHVRPTTVRRDPLD